MVASNFNNYRNSLCHFVAAIFPLASFEEKKKTQQPFNIVLCEWTTKIEETLHL